MNTAIEGIFTLMSSVFTMITGNPLFMILLGIIVVSVVVGIVTSVFNKRRKGKR